MVNEYIRYRIPAEMRTAFQSDYEKAVEYLRASPVCLGYELSQCEEEPDSFVLRISWQSTADHMGKFRGSAEFQGFLPLIRPYMPQIEEMRHYALTELRWNRS
ncbi:MAG: antibiotic biosynthesis monooxygenase family protein [Vicinamibacterales bacterium]